MRVAALSKAMLVARGGRRVTLSDASAIDRLDDEFSRGLSSGPGEAALQPVMSDAR